MRSKYGFSVTFITTTSSDYHLSRWLKQGKFISPKITVMKFQVLHITTVLKFPLKHS